MAALAEELQRRAHSPSPSPSRTWPVRRATSRAPRRLARGFIQVARSPELRALCHILLACLALAAGRPEDADRSWPRPRRLDSRGDSRCGRCSPPLPFLPPRDEIARLRAMRSRVGRRRRWRRAVFLMFAMHNDLHPAIRAWLLGLLELRLGDPAGARQLGRASFRAWLGTGRGDDAELRAETAGGDRPRGGEAGRGDSRLLETAPAGLWFQLTVASPFFSLASSPFPACRVAARVGPTPRGGGMVCVDGGAVTLRADLRRGGRTAHQPFTVFMPASWYRAPAATPLGAIARSPPDRRASTRRRGPRRFSSRYCRRLVPKIGTMSSPCASTHASASCEVVQRFRVASASPGPTRSRFFWKFSPWKRGEFRR